MVDFMTEKLDPWYKNPLGKQRRRNPEAANAESEKRLTYFGEIGPKLEDGFRDRRSVVPAFTVIGSTAMTEATEESDIDIKATAPRGTPEAKYNQMVTAGKEVQEEHNSGDPPYKIEFWFRTGLEQIINS